MINKILITKVWCYDAKLEEMGIDANEWLPFAIELNTIKAIKVTGGSEPDIRNKATIYSSEHIEDSFTIDMDFETVLNLWAEAKSEQ